MTTDLIEIAQRAFQKGDLDRADQLCAEILHKSPKHAPATLLAGLTAARQGRNEKAVGLLEKALDLSPNDYIGLSWLQGALRAAGRREDAVKVGERARALWPDDVDVLVGLSASYLAVRDIPKAAGCLEAAVKSDPMNQAARRKLGIAYELLGRDNDAADQFREAIRLAPNSEEAYVRLGRVLIAHGNFVQALDLCKDALKLLPKSAQLHLLVAQALRNLRDIEPAYEYLNKAIALDPNILISAAMWLHEDGKFDEAAKLFERSIEARPIQGVAYFEIVKGRKVTEEDRPFVAQMEAVLKEAALPPKERAALHYALGKSSNDLKEYEKAMTHFDEGNALNHEVYLAGKRFDPAELARNREAIASIVDREFFDRHRAVSSDSRVPIFVIGMIRSGTTLVEQILSSHPEVGAAGEQRFWVNEIPTVLDLETGRFEADKFVELRDRYMQVLRSFQPESPRITDKMPMNYYCAGLIHLAFPESPIVHIKRHPLDTALSIYMTDLAKPPEFAHSKRNIVEQYKDYLRLMDHWRSVIPPSKLFEIRYEDLISDQEEQTRRLLEACALPWDDRCLQFYSNERQVSTPSMWQVRQPIYRTSMEKWRSYEPWLGEFAELLAYA